MPLEIKSTLRESPIRAVIYGGDGVGKSTFCASAPGSVFIPVEEGLANIDARATPRAETWTQLLEYVDALTAEPSCKSIVIDSIDEAEAHVFDRVCKEGDEKGRVMKDIERFGYGKGYVATLKHWRVLLSALERANAAGKNVLLIAHAHRKTVKNPSGEDYEQWQIKLHDKAAGLFREWAHVVGFAQFDIVTDDGSGRSKGIWTGKRVLRTQPSAGYQSKTRLALPDPMPLDWPAFAEAVAASKPPSVDDLCATLTAKLADLADDEKSRGCMTFLESRGRTLASLTNAISRVDSYIAAKKKEAST